MMIFNIANNFILTFFSFADNMHRILQKLIYFIFCSRHFNHIYGRHKNKKMYLITEVTQDSILITSPFMAEVNVLIKTRASALKVLKFIFPALKSRTKESNILHNFN